MMMEMNEMRKDRDPMELVPVPAAMVFQNINDVALLAEMHQHLIELYDAESQLKKQHKAYLHVREVAEKQCRHDLEVIGMILEHYSNPGKYYDSAISLFKEAFPQPEKQEEATPAEKSDEEKKPDKLDVFALPCGKVFMSTETLGVMEDDMLTLNMAVRLLRDLIHAKGSESDKAYADEMEKLAVEVFDRWDNAELTELN